MKSSGEESFEAEQELRSCTLYTLKLDANNSNLDVNAQKLTHFVSIKPSQYLQLCMFLITVLIEILIELQTVMRLFFFVCVFLGFLFNGERNCQTSAV